MRGARQVFKLFSCVMMAVPAVADIMIVWMGMRNCVRMSKAVVGVGECVAVRVRVVANKCVGNHKGGAGCHNGKRRDKNPWNLFFKKHKWQTAIERPGFLTAISNPRRRFIFIYSKYIITRRRKIQ